MLFAVTETVDMYVARELIEELGDAPEEAVAVAVAYSVFEMDHADTARADCCFKEADRIVSKLHSLGFAVVKVSS